jgi:hydroxypyruvate isomerase
VMKRREFLASSLAAAVLAAEGGVMGQTDGQTAAPPAAGAKLKGRLKQSVSRWCYGKIALDDLCKAGAEMGLKSVELLGEKEWAVPMKYGLVCAVGDGPGGIEKGWNRIEQHDGLVKEAERLLPLAKAAGVVNMVVLSGNREGQSDGEGLKNCVAGLKRITPLAEKLGVTLVLEVLNSKVDHHDYQADHTAFGVEVCKGVGSARLKLLYDIYHMQIMEGDIIRTIRDNIQFIGHFHTGGVPGRNEIDETQELNYAAICKAIVEAGFQGYLGHEFMPTRDPLTSLRAAVALCDV